MSSNINSKLSRSIEMIELATKKMHEKKTGKQVTVKTKALANGVIKITVTTQEIDAEDKTSALMAAQYMLSEPYISHVLIQNNLPERKLHVDDFNLDWVEAKGSDGKYTIVGELQIEASVELYKPNTDWTSIVNDSTIMLQTTSDDCISLDCIKCSITWNRASVA